MSHLRKPDFMLDLRYLQARFIQFFIHLIFLFSFSVVAVIVAVVVFFCSRPSTSD